jgi:hypothetical protein
MSPSSLLRPGLPKSRETLAALACLPTLQGHHPRQGMPPRAGQTLSRTSPAAICSSRAGSTSSIGRASLCPNRGGDALKDRHTAANPCRRRGPAPSRNFRKFLRPALPQTRLLCPVPPRSAIDRAKILLGLVPPGVTTRSPAGSPTPAQAAARCPASPLPWSRSPPGNCVHVVTILKMPSAEI